MKKLLIAGVAALMVVAFTAPAIADMKIGGIVFTDFYYISEDEEAGVFTGVPSGSSTTEDDRSATLIQLPNITRMYARWTNEDNVGLYIEAGIGQTGGGIGEDSNGYGLRHAYGWWDVTPGFRLMVGKSTTPFSPLTPAQTMGTRSGHLNVIGAGYGEYYSGRFAQVRGSFNLPNDMGRVELTLADPNYDGADNLPGGAELITQLGAAPTDGSVDYETVIPELYLTSAMYFGALKLYPGVFWKKTSYDNITSGDDDVTAYGLTFGLQWGTGPFSVQGEINYGENWLQAQGGFYSLANVTAWGPDGGAYYDAATGTIEDAECMGYWVSLGFKVMPNATLYGTFGQLSVENDRAAASGDETDMTSTMYGLRFPIDVAKGFRISPELFFYDDGDDEFRGTDTDFGSYWLLGAQFQVTF